MFPLRDNRAKKMNNRNACSVHSYVYPRSRFRQQSLNHDT